MIDVSGSSGQSEQADGGQGWADQGAGEAHRARGEDGGGCCAQWQHQAQVRCWRRPQHWQRQVCQGNIWIADAFKASFFFSLEEAIAFKILLTFSLFQVSTPAGSAFIVKFDFAGNNGVYHAVDQVL